MSKDPDGYFVGYLKGKRKKYTEQKERCASPEEALAAVGLVDSGGDSLPSLHMMVKSFRSI